jgi:hypothetical protein
VLARVQVSRKEKEEQLPPGSPLPYTPSQTATKGMRRLEYPFLLFLSRAEMKLVGDAGFSTDPPDFQAGWRAGELEIPVPSRDEGELSQALRRNVTAELRLIERNDRAAGGLIDEHDLQTNGMIGRHLDLAR